MNEEKSNISKKKEEAVMEPNKTLGFNLKAIRFLYFWTSIRTTKLSKKEIEARFYRCIDEDYYNRERKNGTSEEEIFQKCRERYKNFVENSFIEPAVTKKLTAFGIPANCLRLGDATQLLPLNQKIHPTPQSIEETALRGFIEPKKGDTSLSRFLTDEELEKLDHLLTNVPSYPICFLLLLIYCFTKRIHFKCDTALDRIYSFMDMLEDVTYDPDSASETALMEALIDAVQTYTDKKLDTTEALRLFKAQTDTAEDNMQVNDINLNQTLTHPYDATAANAFLIREACKQVASAMGFGVKNFPKKFYEFLGCSVTSYDHFVQNGRINNAVKDKLIAYGVPNVCFNNNSRVLFCIPDNIYNFLNDYYYPTGNSNRIHKAEFTEYLKEYLFSRYPDKNNALLSSAKRIVTAIYEPLIYSADTADKFFDMLDELELTGTNMKYKEMKNQLEEIAQSFFAEELQF